MGAGSVIHMTGKTYVDEIYGIGKRMPKTILAFTVVSLGLIGIPPTGGFVSKWFLAQGALTLDNGSGRYALRCDDAGLRRVRRDRAGP